MPHDNTQDKLNIFVIDDSSLVRTLLTQGLTATDPSLVVVGSAINGEDALAQLTTIHAPHGEQPVDIVITDMDMPVMNGLEFIQRMMSIQPLPIILLSSWAQNDKEITLKALEAGAADFVPKPSALNPQGFQETMTRLAIKVRSVASTKGLQPRLAKPSEQFVSQPLAGFQQQSSENKLSTTTQQLNYEKRISQIILGIGEIGATGQAQAGIKTFALGSCIAINLFSPANDIVGMAHVALPAAHIAPDKAKVLPGYFADTAVPALIDKMRQAGYKQSSLLLTAKIAGGASTAADSNNHFKIGERNIQAARSILEAMQIRIVSEDVGGEKSRTVSVQQGSPLVTISLGDRTTWSI
jgi:chemotaxis protein CheD